MNKWIAGLVIGFFAATVSLDAEAQRRLGGGKTFGKPSPTLQQRQAQPPQQSPQQAAPAQQPSAAGAATAAGARAASPWRGALMGLAAGLGLAALASWLGFGEQFAMLMMFALLALVALMAFGMLMRRMRPAQPAFPGGAQQSPPTWQGAGGPSFNPLPRGEPQSNTMARTAATAPVVGGRPGSAMDELMRGGRSLDEPWGIPADFDTNGFLGHARSYFGRLQEAWSTGNLDELSDFTTQEMFTALTHELRARGDAGRSEVVTLEAKLLGMEHDAQEHMASVRFTGTMRVGGEVEPFDEVWNLTKPVDGKSGWLLAGIQQLN
jgi:predicted lipid-binding transport protein (Tim44 family)